MQTAIGVHPRFIAALALLFLGGCVKEITSEERLDRDSQLPPMGEVIGAEELAATHCEDVPQALAQARSESSPESERVSAYAALYSSLKKRSDRLEEALTRNPDLAYQDESQKIVASRELCIQQTADVRVEFERYVRDLVEVPTVQEIKGGSTITIARLDFGTLKSAIQTLAPDDSEQLLARVAAAEKRVAASVTTGSGRKKGR